jgi:spore maturation protein CgeB
MHISWLGSSLVSAYWNGAATYYRGLLRALAARGHRISFYEPDAYDRQQHRDIADPDWAEVVVYKAQTPDQVLKAVERAAAADLMVKASGVGVFDELLERAVLELRRPSGTVAYWDVDAPATLDRLDQDPDDPFHGCVPKYDAVFTYGGGQSVIDAYLRLGARDCVPIYNALDPETHFPEATHPRFAADLAFLGNRLPDREARVEEFFFSPARLLPRRQFLLGGSGWTSDSLPPNVRNLGHVPTGDHNRLNSTATAVLNVNRASMARYGFSPPTRIFEAAGAGACIVSDQWDGIEDFLEPGAEILIAASGPAVAAHLEALAPQRARAIGDAARRRVLAQHTYAHRAAQLETCLAAVPGTSALSA